MKKIIAVVFCALVCTTGAFAQKHNATHDYGRSEIDFSYGFSSIGVIADKFTQTAEDIIQFLDDDYDPALMDIKSGGSKGYFNLGYQYSVNRTLSFGATFGFAKSNLTINDATGYTTIEKAFNLNLFTMMATMKVNWFQYRYFGMYTKYGIGAMYGRVTCPGEDDVTIWAPTAQLSLVSMEFGGRVRGFVELGAGFQGVAQAGLKVYL